MFCYYSLKKTTILSSTKLGARKVFKALHFEDISARTRGNIKLESLRNTFEVWINTYKMSVFQAYPLAITCIKRKLSILDMYIFTPKKR